MTANSGMNFPSIYTITNTISKKVYVGQTINTRRRWHSHRWHLDKGEHRNTHLQRAWKKHGADAFIFAVVVNLTDTPKEELKAALDEAELYVLENTPKTYNLMEAARSGTIPSAKTRALLSKQRLKLWQDPEFRERRRISHSKACADPELQKRRSESLKIAMSTEKYRKERSTIFLNMWQNQEHRDTQSKKRKDNWKDCEYRHQQHQSRRAAWQDPEIRAKRIAGITASHARRKAKRESELNPMPE